MVPAHQRPQGDGLNFPTIPLPLDGQTNGKIRILDQQIALGYTQPDRREQGPGCCGWDSIAPRPESTTLSIGRHRLQLDSRPADEPMRSWPAGCPLSVSRASLASAARAPIRSGRTLRCIDPKVNFTWVKGKHSLKFGYEYEHIWMAVNDNNPLYGSWTYGGGYSYARDSASGANAGTVGRRHLLGRLSLRHDQSVLSWPTISGAPTPDHGQRLRAGRLEGHSKLTLNLGPALGVRFALLRPTTTSRTSIRSARLCSRQRRALWPAMASRRYPRRRLRQDAGES